MTDFEQGEPVVRAEGDPRTLGWFLAEKGNLAFSLGRADQSHALFSECLALAEELDDPFLIGLSHFGLAYAVFLQGDLDGMESHLLNTLRQTTSFFQPWGVAWASFSLGIVAIMRGDTPTAIDHVLESLDLRWSIRDVRGLAESLQVLATLESADGKEELAAVLHGAAELQRNANGLTILPFLRPMHDESVARLHAALGADRTADLWQQGRDTPLEKLVAEVLADRPG